MTPRRRVTRVTLAEVARQSGVSLTTASLILSGRKEHLDQFHPDTIERVRDCAQTLGYRANLFASSLLAGRSTFFALVIHGHRGDQFSSWRQRAYDGELLIGVMEVAAARQIYPVLATTRPEAAPEEIGAIERIMAGGVFGTIVRSPGPQLESQIRRRSEQGHPVVVVFPERMADWPENAVDADNLAAGRLAGDLLARQGRSRWLLIADDRHSESQMLRREGFQEAARRHGASVQIVEIPDVEGAELPDRTLARLFRSGGMDAALGVSLGTSVNALQACVEAGREPGGDILLIGCDCVHWQYGANRRITSIDVSWADAGRAAIRRLLEQEQGGVCRFPSELLAPRVVAGDTCPVPADGGSSPGAHAASIEG